MILRGQVVITGLIFGTLLPMQAACVNGQERSAAKGYQEVGSDKVDALQKLCQATADTGLFSGAVLVADKGEVIYKEAFGKANHEWDIPNTTDTKFAWLRLVSSSVA